MIADSSVKDIHCIGQFNLVNLRVTLGGPNVWARRENIQLFGWNIEYRIWFKITIQHQLGGQRWASIAT